MMPHLTFVTLMAVLISTAHAALGNRTPRERICAGVYAFLGCAATVVLGSWGMYLIHG